jgi:hypothetical protein
VHLQSHFSRKGPDSRDARELSFPLQGDTNCPKRVSTHCICIPTENSFYIYCNAIFAHHRDCIHFLPNYHFCKKDKLLCDNVSYVLFSAKIIIFNEFETLPIF